MSKDLINNIITFTEKLKENIVMINCKVLGSIIVDFKYCDFETILYKVFSKKSS